MIADYEVLATVGERMIDIPEGTKGSLLPSSPFDHQGLSRSAAGQI
jgi:hypothetical protein